MSKVDDVKEKMKKTEEERKELGPRLKNALEKLASKLDVDKNVLQTTLMKTAFKECKTTEEFVSAIIVANTYSLNPILKEMYVFPARGGGITPIVSIDGWISLVNRHKDFDGVELIENEQDGELISVTAKFYLKNKSHPIIVTEYMSECCDDKKEPWKRWPRRMLRHKTYIQGARIAFGFSGIYDPDEGERVAQGQEIEISAENVEVAEDMLSKVETDPASDEQKPPQEQTSGEDGVQDVQVEPFASPEQITKIQILIKEIEEKGQPGFKDQLYRVWKIKSSKDLSKVRASQMIEELTQAKADVS